jgi:hypothetical protein
MNAITNLTSAQFKQASRIKERIERLETQLKHLVDSAQPAAPASSQQASRKTSPARTRNRTAIVQTRNGTSAATQGIPRSRREMSEATRAKISASQRARHAARARAQGKG